MNPYRIYFFGDRSIIGRHDFDADNDQKRHSYSPGDI
jgi:hypothetical protein